MRDVDVEEILEVFQQVHSHETPDQSGGLRERKKRQIRQKISDVATAMFLVHGFDQVTVAQIAAACEVSEQTLFNYFTTKESMFFDRTEPMIAAVADAVRVRDERSLVDVVITSIASEIHPRRWESMHDAQQLRFTRLFCHVASESPTLVAARFTDLPHFIDEVSAAMAQRVGAHAVDPEVRFATFVIAGLVEVRVRSAFHHVEHATSFAELNELIHEDFLRAATLAAPSLDAFDDHPTA